MANSKNLLIEKVETLVTPVLEKGRTELVDLEFVLEHGQWILRFFLDKAGGITLDDCADLSDQLSQVLDAEDPIPQAYSLEVSSPGLYRPLRKEGDYKRFLGERVEIKLYAPKEGRRNFKGLLVSADALNVVVDVDGTQFTVPLDGIAKANLDPEIEI
jgi:ribosome maturation factor RimP